MDADAGVLVEACVDTAHSAAAAEAGGAGRVELCDNLLEYARAVTAADRIRLVVEACAGAAPTSTAGVTR